MSSVQESGCETLRDLMPREVRSLLSAINDDAVHSAIAKWFRPMRGTPRVNALIWVLEDAGFAVHETAIANGVVVVAVKRGQMLHACGNDQMNAVLRLLRVAKSAGGI